MYGERFDQLTRALTGLISRRQAITALAGGALAATFARVGTGAAAACGLVGERCAADGACCAGTRCKNGRCRCQPGRTSCGGRCRDLQRNPNHCGACGNACGAGKRCVTGVCLTGAGTCPTGADFCFGTGGTCDGNPDCRCFTTTEGATRCGAAAPGGGECGGCTRSTDCAAFGPAAFCVEVTGRNCLCPVGQGACAVPCPS